MKDSTYKLIVTLLILVIVIGGGVLLYRNLSGDVNMEAYTPTETGVPVETAPDFTVQDSSDGVYSLSDFRGTPVIVNFWSSNCGPCRSEMPHFQAAWEEYGDEIQFMMVNLTDGYSDTFQSAMEYVREGGYTFPVFFDTESAGAYAYGVYSIPVTYFIDENGVIVYQKLGMMSESQLEDAIALLLGD